MLERYQALGEQIEAAWVSVNKDRAQFPGIAEELLSAFEPPGFDLADIGRFLLDTTVEQQPLTAFSDLPVMLYRSEDFDLELLVWTKGTTTIHQHRFSGAFRVIAGSSLHADYAFDARNRVDERLLLGEVQARDMRLLRVGDVVPIRSGPNGLIHALFHLDNPSATLVARTWHDEDAGPQYELLQPGVALDVPWAKQDPEISIMSRWLSVLMSTGQTRAEASTVETVLALPSVSMVYILLQYGEFLGLDDEGGSLQQELKRRHPDLFAPVLDAFLLKQQRIAFATTRRDIHDPDLRFFMAVLMNATTFEQVSRMVGLRYPGVDIEAQIADWLVRLGAAGGMSAGFRPGSRLLVRLGVALSNAGADARMLLEAMLRGRAVTSWLPQDIVGDAERLRRIRQSERALRTTPELSVLFATG